LRLFLRRPGVHLRGRDPRLRRAGMGGGRLARHAAVVRAGGRRDRRVRRVHDHLLSRAARHEAVKPYLALLLLGLGLVVVVVRLGGGRDGAIGGAVAVAAQDRKSTRLNSSHGSISYGVFCLKKKKTRTAQENGTKLAETIPEENTVQF